jgi:SET domain-containing protein
MNTLKHLVYISDSKIHGQGLFARVDIPKDTVIGVIQGKPCKRDGTYVIWLSEAQAFKVICDLKYINHADHPNACYYDDMSVVALRNIETDEEITHDYGNADW